MTVTSRESAASSLSQSGSRLENITQYFSGKLPDVVFLAGVTRTIFLAGIIYVPTPDDHDTHDFCLAGYILMTGAWFYGMLKFTSGEKNLADSEIMILSEEMNKILNNFDAELEEEENSGLPMYNDGSGTKSSSGSDYSEGFADGNDIKRLKAKVDDRRSKTRKPTAGFSARRKIALAYSLLVIPLIHYMMQHRVHRIPGSYSKYAIFEWLAIILDVAFDAVSTVEFEGLELRVVSAPEALEVEDESKTHYV